MRPLQVLVVGPKTEKSPNIDSKLTNQADNMLGYLITSVASTEVQTVILSTSR